MTSLIPPSMTSRVVIIGGGVAGARTAAALRELEYPGSVDLVCAEEHLPYDRPPLSKECLLRPGAQPTLVNDAGFYAGANVRLHLGLAAVAVDAAARTVRLADHSMLSYDWLVLATGAEPRAFDVPGGALEGVTALRTLSDATFIGQRFEPHKRVVIIGGGFIGLETAAAARERGCEVTVIEASARLMGRSVCGEVSLAFAALHALHGVTLRFGVRPLRFEGRRAVERVYLDDGTVVETDLVIVGVGISPQVGLADDAGLTVDDGVLVDKECRSCDSRIFAVGDCARAPDAVLNRHRRLESWEAARTHAWIAASAIAGTPIPPLAPAWLWSQQYDTLLQISGATGCGGRTVVRGDPARLDFIVFEILDERVIGATAVNRGRDMPWVRRLIARSAPVDTYALANEARPLRAAFEASC